jgi:hypothetical protein
MSRAPERPDPRICGDCGHDWERHLRYPGACADCPCQAFLHNLAAVPAPDAGLRAAPRYRASDEQIAGWNTDEGWDIRRDLLRQRSPDVSEHGRCCECFDAPNMAAGHEHWGGEL